MIDTGKNYFFEFKMVNINYITIYRLNKLTILFIENKMLESFEYKTLINSLKIKNNLRNN